MIEQNTTSAVPMGIFPGPDNFSGNALNPTESVAYRPGFKELIADADVQDAQTQEIPVADTRDLDFTSEGVVYRDRLVPADERCRERLFKKLEAPATYLLGHSPEFQAGALAQHVGRGDFGATPTLILAKDRLLTISRGDLINLKIGETLRAVEEALGPSAETLSVARIGGDAGRLDVDLVSSDKAVTVRAGDILQSGLHIVHDRFGSQATLVETYVLRLVCSNGMTRRECAGNGLVRTRRLGNKMPNGHELQRDQIRRLTRQTWDGLQAQLGAIRETAERPARAEELLARWFQRARISWAAMRERLMNAWHEEGGENTVYGAVNALTRVATHDATLSERQRRVFASLAGLLAFENVHFCPRCLSVLAQHDQHNSSAAAEQQT